MSDVEARLDQIERTLTDLVGAIQRLVDILVDGTDPGRKRTFSARPDVFGHREREE